ncbi:PREDICTED: FK506-binding protein 3-like, partial [Rhagoletis zephyria]|uniref:FK506-binding protein 3-like n=1 Tax=Rhagoletis zephyria TaxID=28612 RepID=UPI00081134C0
MSVDEEFSAVYGQYFHEKDDENDDENYEESDDDEDEVCVSQAEDDTEQTFVKMDLYVVDVKEEELVTKFLSKDCCNNECHTLIPRELIESTRNNCRNKMSKNELDLVILSHIEAGIMSNEKLESVY